MRRGIPNYGLVARHTNTAPGLCLGRPAHNRHTLAVPQWHQAAPLSRSRTENLNGNANIAQARRRYERARVAPGRSASLPIQSVALEQLGKECWQPSKRYRVD